MLRVQTYRCTDVALPWLQVAEREDRSVDPALLFESRSTLGVGSEGWSGQWVCLLTSFR